MIRIWRRATPHGPSTEALAAHRKAHQIGREAALVYSERHRLLVENHFAERIRQIYEGP